MNIREAILEHQELARTRINLVPSEHSMSIDNRLPYLSDVLARYYFPTDTSSNWAFPGNEALAQIYTKCESELQQLTGARFVNLKPISGVNSMTIALSALTTAGSTIATIAHEHGGHSITKDIASRLGLRVVSLPYKFDTQTFDTVSVTQLCTQEKVCLVYVDQCHALFPIDPYRLRESVPDAIPIYYDASHIMGLIFGDVLPNPLMAGVDYLGGSTHKTIPGPHKGFIATNNPDGARAIHAAASTFVSHDHPADTAALALVLDGMKSKWSQYAEQTVRNAQAFAISLQQNGLQVSGATSGYTRTHQVWFRVPDCESLEVIKLLAEQGVIMNTFYEPGITSALSIRAGVQEVTSRGATEETMQKIAALCCAIIKKESSAVVGDMRQSILNTLSPVPSASKLMQCFEELSQ